MNEFHCAVSHSFTARLGVSNAELWFPSQSNYDIEMRYNV